MRVQAERELTEGNPTRPKTPETKKAPMSGMGGKIRCRHCVLNLGEKMTRANSTESHIMPTKHKSVASSKVIMASLTKLK
jgi:hypothetical protein